MRVKDVNIGDIRPYENNPRNNDNAVSKVANSIREFGFKQPIVCNADGIIIAGHTRYKAAKMLGLSTVPVLYADDLTPEQVNAYRLADNKVSEMSTWDDDLLAQELDGLCDFDMEQFGFDPFDEIEENNEREKIREDVESEQKPEIDFSDYIDEASNYVVLKFRTEQEWLQAQSILGLKKVKALSTAKSGKINDSFMFTGIGRVIDGSKAISDIMKAGRDMG